MVDGTRAGGRDGVLPAFAGARTQAALALFALSLLALHPLLDSRLMMGHDAGTYPARLSEWMRALGDRQVPPVWAPDLDAGHGEPLFEFAPPLLYAAATPFRLLGLGLAGSLQLALAVLHAAGVVACYRLARLRRAGRAAAVATAALWLFTPYLALDLYVRAAFAEAAAVAVAPVALLGLVRALERPDPRRVAVAGVGLALLPLAHNAAAFLLFPAAALLVLAHTAAARRAAAAVGGGLALALGLALSAFCWLPALVERDLVQMHLLLEGFLSWRNHLLEPWQLLWSPWGFGLSVPGPDDGMSFALGPLQLVLALAGGTVVARAGDRGRRLEWLAGAAAAVAGAILATTLGAPVFERVPMLQYFQFPWRTILVPALFLPFLALPALERLPPLAAGAAAIVVVLFNLGHCAVRGYQSVGDDFYAPTSIAQRSLRSTAGEYRPHWVLESPPYAKERLAGLDRPLVVRPVRLRSQREEFHAVAPAATEVEAARFYYPETRVLIDGTPVPARPLLGRGTIGFSLPAGEHSVTIEFRPTPVRRVGLGLSSLAGALAAGFALAGRSRTRDQRGDSGGGEGGSAPPAGPR